MAGQCAHWKHTRSRYVNTVLDHAASRSFAHGQALCAFCKRLKMNSSHRGLPPYDDSEERNRFCSRARNLIIGLLHTPNAGTIGRRASRLTPAATVLSIFHACCALLPECLVIDSVRTAHHRVPERPRRWEPRSARLLSAIAGMSHTRSPVFEYFDGNGNSHKVCGSPSGERANQSRAWLRKSSLAQKESKPVLPLLRMVNLRSCTLKIPKTPAPWATSTLVAFGA